MKKTFFLFRVIIAAIFFLAACGSDSEKEAPKIGISGQLNNGYKTGRTKADPQVNEVWAVSIGKGNTCYANWDDLDTVASVGEDGKFEISLSTNYDWVLLLVDSTQPDKRDQVLGYAAMTDPGDNLIKMPISKATGDIDLGEMNANGDEAESTTTVEDNTHLFQLELSQLRELARTDNLLKTIKNSYVNYVPGTEGNNGDNENIYFNWTPDLNEIKNTFNTDFSRYSLTDPDTFFTGFTVNLHLPNNPPSFADLTKEVDRVPFGLYPPSNITDGAGHTWGPNVGADRAGFINDNWPSTGVINELGFYDEDYEGGFASSTDELTCFWGYFPSELPAGWWNLQVDGVVRSYFDLAYSDPFDETGIPSVYLPSLRVNVNETDVVTSVDINWYLYDPLTLTFSEITDRSILASLFAELNIGITDYGPPRIDDGQYFDDSTVNNYVLENEILFENLEEVAIEYWIGVIKYNFSFRKGI